MSTGRSASQQAKDRTATSALARLGLALTIVAAMLAGQPGTPATAAHPGSNGPLLVDGGQGFGLVPPAGGAFVSLDPLGGVWDAKFSPNGSKIAYSVHRNGVGIVRVRSAGGSDSEIARIPGQHLVGLTWSPDSSKIAIAASPDSAEGMKIYRVGSNGSGLTVIRDLGSKGVVSGGVLDWHPTADRIALIFGSDVWTIDSAGGSATQWTSECSYPAPLQVGEAGDWGPCDTDGDQVSRTYQDRLSWSPSGTSLLVGMSRFCFPSEEDPKCSPAAVDGGFLASLPVGSGIANPVTAWPNVPGTDYFGELRATSSPDGAQYAHLDGDGTIITAGFGGAPNRVGQYKLFDWQPCPGGRCANFANGTPTTITQVNQISGSCSPSGCTTNALVATGKVAPRVRGVAVTVTLEAERNGSWATVATNSPRLSRTSTYRTSFQIPADATKCRVTSVFPGSGRFLSSSISKSFLC